MMKARLSILVQLSTPPKPTEIAVLDASTGTIIAQITLDEFDRTAAQLTSLRREWQNAAIKMKSTP